MITTSRFSTILMALSLGTLCITAQPGPHKKEMAGEHKMAMSNEPHHMLAMAYRQIVATFAKSFAKQANDGTLNVEFARTAVKEMRRSFDEMQLHHDAHMKTMPAGRHTKMEGMMRKMEMHWYGDAGCEEGFRPGCQRRHPLRGDDEPGRHG